MPRQANLPNDSGLLQAALEGLELQRKRIEEQIQQVRSMMGAGRGGRTGQATSSAAAERPARVKRELSPAARRRIAAAQKKRWAEYRKKSGSSQ